MMQKQGLKRLSIILFLLFVISTIATIIIVFQDSNSVFAFRFIIGYVIFLFIFMIYSLIVMFMRLKKLSAVEIRKRFIRFIVTFIVLSAVSLGYDYFFRSGITNYYNVFLIPFGLSVGVNFFDIVYESRKGDI